MFVRRLCLSVEPPCEHNARHLLLQQQLDIVRFGHTAHGPGTENGSEALLGKSTSNDLGEGRKDRILEFGQHQTHQSRLFPPQLGRALVAEDVKRGEDGFLGRLGYPWPLIEDPADRCLADPDLRRYIC